MSKNLSEMTLEELWQLFPIILTEHKDCWEQYYAEEAAELKKLLPKGAKINHIGSTAVKGIWAKPIVDILVEVETGFSEVSAILQKSGWIKMSETERRMSFNKGYTEEGFAEKVFHLHLRCLGDNDEIYFRDYLNANPEVAKEYERLKLELRKKFEHDRDGYTQAKSGFVQKYTALAKGISHIENGIYGLAIGDALGVPYEFSSREKTASAPCVKMIGGGTHGQPVGTWSDDTSLTLATLDGLSEMKADDDYEAVMSRFDAWLNKGEYSVDGVFDVGGTTMEAILRFRQGIPPVNCGGREVSDNGNGSLMRILPAVLYSIAKYGKINYGFIDDISALTHGHIVSKVACRIYADIVRSILLGADKDKILAAVDIHGQKEFARLKSAGFCALPENKIKSGGYVVDTLEAALWCFLNTENFKECVLKAVNLGNDTDTVAAVAGSLAGLYYGKQSIPGEWLEVLRGKELIDRLIKSANR